MDPLNALPVTSTISGSTGVLAGSECGDPGSGTSTSTVYTPSCSEGLFDSAFLPLVIRKDQFEHILSIPASLNLRAFQIKQGFMAQFTSTDGQFSAEEAPKSKEELLMRFIAFVANSVDKMDTESQNIENRLFRILLDDFEKNCLKTDDIHTLALRLLCNSQSRLRFIKSYYSIRLVANHPSPAQDSALFVCEKTKVYTIFGGQGNTKDYFEELREIFDVYPGFIENLVSSSTRLLLSLSRSSGVEKQFPRGLDIMKWLSSPDKTPSSEYLITAPVSFPLIGLLQLAHYSVACKVMGTHPGSIRIQGSSGHSQGIVVAAAIAASGSWSAFEKQAICVLTILFWIGVRSQQAFPETSLPSSIVQDSIDANEGTLSPMLSVRGLSQKQLQEHINSTNLHLDEDRQIHVGLYNGPDNMVVTGPPLSLHGLNVRLRKIKASSGLDQARIPHSKRKIQLINRFLPMTAPFHSTFLRTALVAVNQDVNKIEIRGSDLHFPVYDTFTGVDLRKMGDTNIVPRLIRLVMQKPIHWEKATIFPGATHILDFGPGGRGGLGALTSQTKEGIGVRVILVGVNEPSDDADIGYRAELFGRFPSSIRYGVNWAKDHSPTLIRNAKGQTCLSTKLSRLLGLPPVFVAGMTPTTVHWDFVSAIMHAGYHVELAAGGYYQAKDLTIALKRLQSSIPLGRGITINVIYVNPRALAWQIPLIRSLRAGGVPIEGLTIGAGIPSLEVAKEYTDTLGLRHISFKPGSAKGIDQVIDIANAAPDFPIILQWTGGRAGGHHSYEDFHAPIAAAYGKIRKCSNIVLVAGSGFGSSEDTYPYLTGDWALQYGYSSKMPFDGCLFGSRMMIAKEARTSPAAKRAIVEAEGVEDSQWERTYGSDGGGGVLTVISEMGEPIHKLATRGVKFWSEMDRKIFSLPKDQQVEELRKNSKDIIQRLNEDYQKVWFGQDAAGNAVKLEEMTYGEVARRLVALLFLVHDRRWIDDSYEKLTIDFLLRTEQRFGKNDITASMIFQNLTMKEPSVLLNKFFNIYPEVETTFITSQDVQYFLSLCQRLGQKPVPFIPILDEDFEFYFKKDSLWQSEELEAIIDQDAGRTCILQGPVAVRYSKVMDEPVKDILDGISHGHMEALLNDFYQGNLSKVPTVEYFGGNEPVRDVCEIEIEGLEILQDDDQVTYQLNSSPETPLPSLERWLCLLAGENRCWRSAMILSEIVIEGNTFKKNPIRSILAPVTGLCVGFSSLSDPSKTIITVREPTSSGDLIKVVEVQAVNFERIVVNIVNNSTACGEPVPLTFLFSYHPEAGYAPIRQILEGHTSRVRDFYWKTWFGNEKPNIKPCMFDTFDGGAVEITAAAIDDFVHAVGNKSNAFIDRHGRGTLAPMDFAIIAGWKALIKPLFAVDGDLLNLVHLSNSFRMMLGARSLCEGDVISATGSVLSVQNQDSGRIVEVGVTIRREALPVMEIVSSFFYRGIYNDFEDTFQRKKEKPVKLSLSTKKDLAVLKSKPWFLPDDPDIDLLGQELTFRLQTLLYFKDRTVFSSIRTTGKVTIELPTKEIRTIASVDYNQDVSHGNPVMEYLKRFGHSTEEIVLFDKPIPLHNSNPICFGASESNQIYAQISADFNPIHVSRIFSACAGLPGTITHGMHTSATVRSIVETHAADGKPGRVLSYKANFTGMVLPGDEIEVYLWHTGMLAGRKVIKIEARNSKGHAVLTGEAEVEQPTTAYIFTGQGSQEVNMGMELAAKSPVAKEVWDRADKFLLENYGFNITDIVKNNPKELTVFFGGERGEKIRENYMAISYQTVDGEGLLHSRKMFPITDSTHSYTYRSPSGLLFATQFTQQALTLMERARFEDMRSRGLIITQSAFAGHSLGEYGALASYSDLMSVEDLVSIVFFRGLTMQAAVERDVSGRSAYSMLAVNPSRVSHKFNEASLQWLISQISQATGCLLEIVNYNITNMQYACAGDVRALEVLGNICSTIKKQGIELPVVTTDTTASPTHSRFVIHKGNADPIVSLINNQAKVTLQRSAPLNGTSIPNIELRRGAATIPLTGIDVPFHSSFLRQGILPFRHFLEKNIDKSAVKPAALVGKWIPNLTGRTFGIMKEDFEEVYRLTQSVVLGDIVKNWARYTGLPEKQKGDCNSQHREQYWLEERL